MYADLPLTRPTAIGASTCAYMHDVACGCRYAVADKIVAKKIPSTAVYEDDQVYAFRYALLANYSTWAVPHTTVGYCTMHF
ncbi:MAG: hypothetical protein EOO65_03395 [Methanosarcinales archaeon]|nr:MAG: hypothetical protein EOO65_03395 [Methanosarcinales archaeon]